MKNNIILILIIGFAFNAKAQVPVTVNRSTVMSGGTVSLPPINGQGVINSATLSGGISSIASFNGNSSSVISTPAYMSVTSTGGSGTPSSYNWSTSPGTVITSSNSPNVVISTNAPSVFTNIVSATPIYNNFDHNAGYVTPLNQSYIITIAEDGSGGGGGGSTAQNVALTGQSDPLESVSRKDTSTEQRKLIGFQLRANTNSVLRSLAFALSNSSTNGPNLSNITLYRDADGQNQFDLADTLIAATTNANGFAVYSGLSEPIGITNRTYFVAASFMPTNQTRNSFVTASLNSQNIVVTLASTNTAIPVNGGSNLGKQYAFLDTSQAEDDAAAAALASQINSSVTGATNAQAAAFNSQLNAATNAQASAFASQLADATKNLGNTTVVQGSTTSKKNSLMDSVLPAAAAGAAAVGAAFTSDSLNKTPLSRDYIQK